MTPQDRTALKRLKQAALNKITTERPNLPYPESFVHDYKVNSANGITRAVIDWIRFNGGQAERISVTGRMVDGTKKVTDVMGHSRIVGSVSYQKSSMTKGSADISATLPPHGRSLKIEIKYGKDRQSQAQKQYEQSITGAGGIYLIVHTFEDFLRWWDSRPAEGVQTELFTK